MRELDMDKMLRDIDKGKGPKQAAETKPFYDKYRKPEEGEMKKKKGDMDDMHKKGKMPTMRSYMPKGATQSPAGDLGARRGKESVAAGGFKVGGIMTWPKKRTK